MVAHRTLDNDKKSLAHADSTALSEDDMAGAAGDLPEDDLDAASAQDEATTEPAAADEADEDLRVVPTSRESAAAVDRPAGRGNTIIDRLLANPVTRFPTESGLELWSKVTWPEPRYAWNMTLVVIAMSVFVAIVLGAADLGLSQFVTWVVSHSGAAPIGTPTPVAPSLPVPGNP